MKPATFDLDKFKEFVSEFENLVVIPGLKSGRFGLRRKVPVRMGKLDRTIFGLSVGPVVNSKDVFAIDYYGYIKKSEGFFDYVESELKKGNEIKMVQCSLVYFASIKRNDVIETGGKHLIKKFFRIKYEMLRMRGFKK